MLFGAIGYFTVTVGKVLRFGGQRVIIIIEEFLDVPFHGEAEIVLLVVPVKFYAVILLSFPVSGDGVVLFQSKEEVFSVAFLHIINAKIIYY